MDHRDALDVRAPRSALAATGVDVCGVAAPRPSERFSCTSHSTSHDSCNSPSMIHRARPSVPRPRRARLRDSGVSLDARASMASICPARASTARATRRRAMRMTERRGWASRTRASDGSSARAGVARGDGARTTRALTWWCPRASTRARSGTREVETAEMDETATDKAGAETTEATRTMGETTMMTTSTTMRTTMKSSGSGRGREMSVLGVMALAVAAETYALGGPAPATARASEAVVSAARGLVENHAPGMGGIIEDGFLGLLTVGTVYALWRSSAIPRPIGNPIARKSKTNASWVHVFTGAGGLAMALYAVGLERIYRESPGWTWMWVSSAMFMANALTYGPLMNIFKASKEGKYAMKLGYSFVASFQGVVWIAWSAQPDAPDWMFWAVMPYWYFSLAKLWESTEFVLALTPKPTDADGLWATMTAGSRQRLGRMTPDAATLTYVGLNAAAAVFDNCYMALYTLLGPEQFWHTSQAFNDSDFHLRLVKGTTGSLTVALLIFISTLGWRKQMPMKYAVWLNVVLGSVGPWIVLFWHKLLDPSEDWFPQFVFDPNFAYHVYLNPSISLFGN